MANVMINTDTLDFQVYVINDYSLKIKKVLNDISEEMSNALKYYDCESGKMLMKKFNIYKENFNIIYRNLLTYKKDLRTIKLKYVREQNILSNMFIEKSKEEK